MFWVPYAGVVPLGLVWPSGVATTSLSLAAVIAAGRLALLMVKAARQRSKTVPQSPTALVQEQEVNQAAA